MYQYEFSLKSAYQNKRKLQTIFNYLEIDIPYAKRFLTPYDDEKYIDISFTEEETVKIFKCYCCKSREDYLAGVTYFPSYSCRKCECYIDYQEKYKQAIEK